MEKTIPEMLLEIKEELINLRRELKDVKEKFPTLREAQNPATPIDPFETPVE